MLEMIDEKDALSIIDKYLKKVLKIEKGRSFDDAKRYALLRVSYLTWPKSKGNIILFLLHNAMIAAFANNDYITTETKAAIDSWITDDIMQFVKQRD